MIIQISLVSAADPTIIGRFNLMETFMKFKSVYITFNIHLSLNLAIVLPPKSVIVHSGIWPEYMALFTGFGGNNTGKFIGI